MDQSLEAEKAPGVGNIPSEILKDDRRMACVQMSINVAN